MVKSLIDAGPMIALFDSSDQFHQSTITFFKQFKGEVFTTWPVLTETSHMLDFNLNAQLDFYEWISRDIIKVVELTTHSFRQIRDLSEKYGDVPMDLADASLLLTAEKIGVYNIISLDSDYQIYRIGKKKYLTNLMETFI